MQTAYHHPYQEIRTMAALIASAVLGCHLYYYCYAAFAEWRLTAPIVDHLVLNLVHSGMFHHRFTTKLIAICFIALTLIGRDPAGRSTGKKKLLWIIPGGISLYFGCDLILSQAGTPTGLTITYIGVMAVGLSLIYSGLRSVFALIQLRFSNDIFNRFNESFPQEERRLPQPYSFHLRAQYTFRNQVRDSWINLLDGTRGTLVCGVPGVGKTRYVFRQLVQQSLDHGMALFVYDLKYDNLTRLTYNSLERTRPTLTAQPQFFSINFDDLNRSHRCNPLDPAGMHDISDATEYARTLLYAINKRWITQQGEFFVESAIAFFTANTWFLRQYQNGRYCTLPHLIELLQTDFYKLFSVLRSYPDLQTHLESFVSALRDGTLEQLQGQVATARIALAGLASPHLYYILSGNDFSLDINNPAAPKVVCIGSNPQKQYVYGAVISLYVTRLLKLVNNPGRLPCHILLDEFPSFYAHGIHLTLSQAREAKVAVTLGIQDFSQLRMEYGRDHADAIFNLPANLICGQVSGETARLVSDRFGRILQEKNTVSINSRDSSTSRSHNLDPAIPASRISTLSAGEFVGITADIPNQPIKLKAFHARIVADHAAIAREEASYEPVPEVRQITRANVEYNYQQIKKDVQQIVEDRLAYMMTKPALEALIVRPRGIKRGPQNE
jgi:hypothetical protein